jgi:outer membrane receptor protein involved in Fe transport
LPGVSIVEKGTTNGTISDFNGGYQVSVSNEAAVLVYSFIGFVNQEKPVSGKTQINVVMAEEVTGLDEVVVVGYGEMRKSDLTGSVSSLTVDNATESGAPSVDQLLQGRVSGVSVKSPSGVPGGAVQINIRGVGSMSASTQPLYVIDGMILDQIPFLFYLLKISKEWKFLKTLRLQLFMDLVVQME